MIIRNTKFLILAFLCSSGFALFFMQYRATLYHSLISSNYANLQNNPFEFVAMSNHPYYEKILVTIREGLDEPLENYFSPEELVSLGLTRGMWSLSGKALLQQRGYEHFTLLDKQMRKVNISRYSLLTDLRHLDGSDMMIAADADHLTLWDRYYNSRINEETVRLPSGKPLPSFAKAKVGLKLFDILMIRILEKKDLLSTALKIQHIFYQGAIGEARQKAIQLYRFYQQSDIICMQESSKYIVDLMAKEYHVTGRPGACVIFLKKGVWKKIENICIHVGHHPIDDILLIVAEHEKSKKRIVLGSIHSDNRGRYSIPILKAIMKVIKSDPKLHDMPIILGHDANTAVIRLEGKVWLQDYWNIAEKLGFQHVFDLDAPTTSKVRSWAQTQFSKADLVIENKNDWLLVYKIIVQNQDMTYAGPNEENPSDHAILYIRFSLP